MKSFSFIASFLAVAAAKRQAFLYVDDWNCATASCLVPYLNSIASAGGSDVILAFSCPRSNADVATDYMDTVGYFAALSDADRQNVLSTYKANNAQLWLSIGGGSYGTQFLNLDPVAVSNNVCSHAKSKGYIGVDFDLEGFDSSSADRVVQWAITASKTCRNHVSKISHAPQSPYLGLWLQNKYVPVLPYADYFFVQYYNQWIPQDTYQALFVANEDNDAFEELKRVDSAIASKLVIGKFLRPQDGGNGRVTADVLDAILKEGETKNGYQNGFMIWKVPMAGEAGDLANFLNQQLPLLVNGGVSPSAPVVVPTSPSVVASSSSTTTTTVIKTSTTTSTASASTTTTTTPSTSTTTTTTTTPSTSTTTTTTTTPKVGGAGQLSGDTLNDCKAIVGYPAIPSWDENCDLLCAYYIGAGQAFCPGSKTGRELAECVVKMSNGSCNIIA